MYIHVHTRLWFHENVWTCTYMSVQCSDTYVPFFPILSRWSVMIWWFRPRTRTRPWRRCGASAALRIRLAARRYFRVKKNTTWLEHLEPRFLVYVWYMYGIYHTYGNVFHMYGICMVYVWYVLGYTIHMFYSGYTMYIQGYAWYILKVYTWHIHVYPWYMFSCIYMVYPWIYLDIPSFLKPDFSAGPCCWIHAMLLDSCNVHTFVGV